MKFTSMVALLVVLGTLLAPVSASAALQRADSYAIYAIKEGQQVGIFPGTLIGEFRAQDAVTRREFAVMLAKALRLAVQPAADSVYADVLPAEWGSAEIDAVRRAGLMGGHGEQFRPEEGVTREELAVVLVKAYGMTPFEKGYLLPFADREEIAEWANPSVKVALDTGLMRGDGVNFYPKRSAKRQEAAVLAMQLLHNHVKQIEGVGDGNVTISGITFAYPERFGGILSAENAEVLQGAEFSGGFRGNYLFQVAGLELRKSGVFDAKGGLMGDLHVAAKDMTVKNVNLSSWLTIEDAVTGDVHVENAKAEHAWVEGPARVVLNNSTVPIVELTHEGTVLEITGTTKIGEIFINADVLVRSEQKLKKVVVRSNTNFRLDAEVETLEFKSPDGGDVTLLPNARVEHVIRKNR